MIQRRLLILICGDLPYGSDIIPFQYECHPLKRMHHVSPQDTFILCMWFLHSSNIVGYLTHLSYNDVLPKWINT
jgi:hypothetical protein